MIKKSIQKYMDKKCLRCGRLMYVNDYCKKCLKEIKHEELLERAEKDPSIKHILDRIIEEDRMMDEARKKYSKERRQKHSDLYIAEKLRSRVRTALKTNSETKLKEHNAIIGCSILEFRAYLENKFESGMTWENYGNNGWHIDHIKPCQDFDLTQPEQQKKCFYYSNLQPMWAMDNFKKNGRYNRRN